MTEAEMMTDPRRLQAIKELNDVIAHIRADAAAQGNATYCLTVLPPLLKKLEEKLEAANVIEAMLLAEEGGEMDD